MVVEYVQLPKLKSVMPHEGGVNTSAKQIQSDYLGMPPGLRPVQVRPPPLNKIHGSQLPPMPRLKLGSTSNPLNSIISLVYSSPTDENNYKSAQGSDGPVCVPPPMKINMPTVSSYACQLPNGNESNVMAHTRRLEAKIGTAKKSFRGNSNFNDENVDNHSNQSGETSASAVLKENDMLDSEAEKLNKKHILSSSTKVGYNRREKALSEEPVVTTASTDKSSRSISRSSFISLCNESSISMKKKKKKKKSYRGINYRFDGSIMRYKRASSSSKASFNSEVTSFTPIVCTPDIQNNDNMNVEEPKFMSYLGISRKRSASDENGSSITTTAMCDENVNKKLLKTGPTARKSMRSAQVSSNSDEILPSDEFSCNSHFLSHESRQNGVVSATSFSEKVVALQKSDKPELSSSVILETEEDEDLDDEEDEILTILCNCQRPSSGTIDISTDEEKEVSCQAIESIGPHRVGCTNPVQDSILRGPADIFVEPLLLCPLHVKRLEAHQCCPFCGEYCSQGSYFMCRVNASTSPHFFHRQCYKKYRKNLPSPTSSVVRRCPHCNSSSQPILVELRLAVKPSELQFLSNVAKMSFYQSKQVENSSNIDVKKESLLFKYEAPPGGKEILCYGLPDGFDNKAFEQLISVLENKQTIKHTTRNMLIPTRQSDNVKLVQLLSIGYSPNQVLAETEGQTPLHVAAAEGHVLTTHILVQAGAGLNALDSNMNTPLMLACVKGHTPIVKYLLQVGADPSIRGEFGMTGIHLAAQNGSMTCVEAFLSKPSLRRKYIDILDDGGWTPLVWACENKHEDVVRYMLRQGADPLIRDNEGNISLHWASLSGVPTTCELLLDYACDVNIINKIGESPLHIAVRMNQIDCIMLLLMRGARLDLRNHVDCLPIDFFTSPSSSALSACYNVLKLGTVLHELMTHSGKVPWKNRRKFYIPDITKSKEPVAISCVNEIDDCQAPKSYVYIRQNCVTTDIPIIRNIELLRHCSCEDDSCGYEDICHCADLSIKSWYDENGRLKEGFNYKNSPMIFECNDLCSCNVDTCHNRVMQHGITVRLQVFRSEGMGWGVRVLADIEKGTFVCEYVGEIISDSEADKREDSYLFDLDNRDDETYCLDANRYGNIARFINHCCTPNLIPVKVFSDHQDLRFPHIALFANRFIPKGSELGFDYGERFWVIKHKYFTCYCASDRCKYNKVSIAGFLRDYYARTGEKMPDEVEDMLTPKEIVLSPKDEETMSINGDQEPEITFAESATVTEPTELISESVNGARLRRNVSRNSLAEDL